MSELYEVVKDFQGLIGVLVCFVVGKLFLMNERRKRKEKKVYSTIASTPDFEAVFNLACQHSAHYDAPEEEKEKRREQLQMFDICLHPPRCKVYEARSRLREEFKSG